MRFYVSSQDSKNISLISFQHCEDLVILLLLEYGVLVDCEVNDISLMSGDNPSYYNILFKVADKEFDDFNYLTRALKKKALL